MYPIHKLTTTHSSNKQPSFDISGNHGATLPNKIGIISLTFNNVFFQISKNRKLLLKSDSLNEFSKPYFEAKNNEVPDTQKPLYVEKDNVITTRCSRKVKLIGIFRSFYISFS